MGQAKEDYIDYEIENETAGERYGHSYQAAYEAGYAAAMAKVKRERAREVELILNRVSRVPERSIRFSPVEAEAASSR